MKASPLPITLLVTGGTLDKDYQATTGDLIFSETHLPKLLKEANSTLPIKLKVLMLKDSLELLDSDRQKILDACLESETDRIVITHGTDTMTDTALFLKNSRRLTEKTIILTGAMRPFQLNQSDASFNLGAALMASQLASPGVYIAMNGELFEASQVSKNRQQGIFELHT